jgi:monoamine oxidase
MKVIVVGAGVSGLVCAAELARAGADVTVLDARDRIGGRVWAGDVAGATVDLGAAWIHGPHGNPLAEYCRQEGIGWKNDGAWGDRMQVHREDGGLVPQLVATAVVASRADFDPAEAVDATGREMTLAEAIEWYLADRRFDGETSAAVRFNLAALEGGLNIGADPDSISATGAGGYRLHGGGNVVVDGGYGTLVDHLAEGLDIRLEDPVLAIEETGGRVIVSTAAGSERADRAVVTVPIGVLRSASILFSPTLPSPVVTAIDRLRPSTVEKIVLRYPERWWPDGLKRLTFISEDGRFPAWTDFTVHAGAPTMVGFFNPGLSRIPPDEGGRFEMAVETLTRMLGKGPKPIGAMVTDWLGDPYSRGSYSYIPVGAGEADMRVFQLVDGPILFAGEHTVPEYFGTVHGAFVSGRRAAGRILDA